MSEDSANQTKFKNFSIKYNTFGKIAVKYREVVQEIVIVKQEINPGEGVNYGILDAFEDMYDHIE